MADNIFDNMFLSQKELDNLEKAKKQLDEIAQRQIRNNNLSEEQIRNIKERVQQQKIELQQEATLNAIRDKSISQVKSLLANKERQLQNQIKMKTYELEITADEETRVRLQGELTQLISEQVSYKDRIRDIDRDSLSTANTLLTLEKQRQQYISKITKDKQEQAKEDKLAYMDLVARREAGDTSISDEDVSVAKKKAASSQLKSEGFAQIVTILGNLKDMLSKFAGSLLQKMDSAINMYSEYKGIIDARLQTLTGTTAKTFDSINKTFQNQLQTTGYLSYTELISNVDRLTKEGISYNIEERAFLETVSDKMVT